MSSRSTTVLEAHAEIHSFQAFLSEKVQHGEPYPSPEEVLEEWRLLHPGDVEDDYEAIKKSIDAMHSGEPATSVEKFDREFRMRNAFPPRS